MTAIEEGELRKSLSTLVHLHHYGFCENIISHCYKKLRKDWTPECEARAKQYEDKLVDFIQARDKEIVRKARETALEDAQKAIADFNYKSPIARQCWYAVDALRPHKYVAASSHREEES